MPSKYTFVHDDDNVDDMIDHLISIGADDIEIESVKAHEPLVQVERKRKPRKDSGAS